MQCRLYSGTVFIDADAASFDADVYRILKRFLAAPRGAHIVELD